MPSYWTGKSRKRPAGQIQSICGLHQYFFVVVVFYRAPVKRKHTHTDFTSLPRCRTSLVWHLQKTENVSESLWQVCKSENSRFVVSKWILFWIFLNALHGLFPAWNRRTVQLKVEMRQKKSEAVDLGNHPSMDAAGRLAAPLCYRIFLTLRFTLTFLQARVSIHFFFSSQNVGPLIVSLILTFSSFMSRSIVKARGSHLLSV